MGRRPRSAIAIIAYTTALACCGLVSPAPAAAAAPAFPGAVGFGAQATGGRGGDVYP